MKKIYSLLIILIGVFMVNISDIKATCYKVVDVHSYSLVEYTKNNSKYQDTSKYKVEQVDKEFCETDKVSCGNLGKFNKKLPEISSWLITLLQVAVPVILIIMGVIDFVKSLSSQKDDEIKKGQQMFIKRVITAIIIFFVVVVVKLLVSLVSSGQTEKESIVKCIDCFISNKCE